MKNLPYYLLIISNFILSKDIIINAKILSSDKLPIQYASITCDDSYAISDNNGDFTLKCNESSDVIVTYIGYKKNQISIEEISKFIYLYPKEILTKEVKIYGGLNSNISDTRIKIINKSEFNLNGKDSFQDIILSNPELNFAAGTSSPRYIQIRGLGELSQFSGEGAPHFYVGVFLDDINFTGIGGISLLDDINQIEIFKGPQSTAFGANAMAGAINMVSSSPNFEKSFTTKISYNSFNTQKYSFNINYPLTKKISSNISLIKNDSDGYIKNTYLHDENSNSKDEFLTKIKLLYSPNNFSKYLFTYYYINLDNKYDAWTVDNNGYNTLSDFQGTDNNKTKAFSLKSLFNLNQLKLSSITSYSNNYIDYTYDGDWGNIEMWGLEPYNWDEDTEGYSWDFPDITNRKRKLLSQELRFSIKNLLFGLYTSKLNEKDERTGYFFSGNWDDMKSIFNIYNTSLYTKYNYIKSNQYNINVSLRYDSYRTINDLYYRSSYYPGPYDYQERRINDYNIGWNVLFNKYLNSYSNLIISVSKGYKTSGINQSPNFSNNPSYKTEESINTEIGYFISKNRIKLRNSIFYMHRDNPQLRLFIQNNTDFPTYFDYATFNGSTSYTYGIETNISYEFSSLLTFNLSANILKNHIGTFYFDEDGDGNVEKFGDRSGSHSPKLGISLGTKVTLSNNLSLNIDTNYKDEFYFDEQNDHKSKNYSLLNASLVYNKDKFSLSLWGKNLTNEKYSIRGYSFVLEPYTASGYTDNKSDYRSYGEKKSLGITFQYSL